MATYSLTINGKKQQVEAAEDMPLLWVIRDLLDMKGTKFGCGQALCGACTILLGDSAVRSCTLPISAVGEEAVTTIEGLSENGDHPLQKAWIEHIVPQCGYCLILFTDIPNSVVICGLRCMAVIIMGRLLICLSRQGIAL